MTRATIIVRIGEKLLRIRGVRGKDGLIVADRGGVTASKDLLARCRRDFQERIKPKPFSPFRPFRMPYKASV